MKVHLLKKKPGHFLGFSRINTLFTLLVCLMIGIKSPIWAEGSKDFVNYPGLRMFLDTRDPQQLKVYAAAGETINVGSSHVGIEGGFIHVISPDGDSITVFNNSGATTDLAIINDWLEEQNGPTGNAAGGYDPGTVTVPNGMSGIWTVIFDYPTYVNTSFNNIANDFQWTKAADQPNTARVVLAWDITVTQNGAGNAGGEQLTGRVYSNEHISLLQGNSEPGDTISTSPTFYVLTEDAYLYEVNIMEADPYRFPISSNSLGLVDGTGAPIYKSKPEADFTRTLTPLSGNSSEIFLYEPQAQDLGSIKNNKIFFNVPDSLMPSTALVTDVFRDVTHETWLIDTLEILTIDSLYLLAQSVPGTLCNPGTIEFEKGAFFVFETNLGGVVTLELDLNNDGDFDDDVDVVLMEPINEGLDSIFWNGDDGLGNPIAVQDSFTFNYQGNIRFGELHIALTDVEGNPGGVSFLWMNAPTSTPPAPPGGFPIDQFYYDHSDIDTNVSISVSSPDGMSGVANDPKPTNIPYTYLLSEGNNDYIDQWFFIEQPIEPNSVTVNIVLDCFCDPEDLPALQVAGDSVCVGEELTLSATNTNTTNNLGPLDYVWTGPNGFIFSDSDVDPAGTSTAFVTNDATLANDSIYTVIVNTSSFCADTASVPVVVKLTPILETDDATLEVCESGDIQLCASNTVAGIGQLTCEWTGPNFFSASGTGSGTDEICITITGATSAQEGQYTLVCTADGCESDPLSINLDVQPTPVIVINSVLPGNSVCVGETVELTANNNQAGTGPIIFTWNGPGGYVHTDTVFNENDPFTCIIPNIQLQNAGDYTLDIETLAGCEATSQIVTIEVNPNPEICETSGEGDACIGQNVTLSALNCETLITGNINFEWIGPNGSSLSSGTLPATDTFSYEILNIQQPDSGQYCLILTDAATNCSAQSCFDVNVLPNIVIMDTIPDGSYCPGTTITLTGSTNFNAPVTYTWTAPNGSPLCSPTIVGPGAMFNCDITIQSPDDVGNYVLTVASLDGCQAEPDTVFIGLLDSASIETLTGGGTYCPDDEVTLSATVSSNADSVKYTWLDPSNLVIAMETTVPAGPFDITLQNPASGTYTFIVMSVPDNCGDTATVQVELVDQPVLEILNPADTTICENDSLLLCFRNTNPDIVNFTYTWTTPDSVITGSGTGTDIICDEIDPAMPFGSGMYILEICADNCCSDPDTINVNLNPNPIISDIFTESGQTTFCEGDTAIICFYQMNDSVTDWFYTCNIDTFQVVDMGMGNDTICIEVTTSTFIFCSMESVDGCTSDLAGFQVTFLPNLTPEVTVDSTICENESLPLDGTNNSMCTDTVIYTWTGPGNFMFSDTALCTGPFPAEDPNPMTGEYCLYLDNIGSGAVCSDTVCVDVVVFELPTVVNGPIDGGGEYCEGEDINLSATIENPSGGDIIYEWTQNGMVVSSDTAVSGTVITLMLTDVDTSASGDYCLNLTCVETGCSDEGLGCTDVIVNITPTIDSVTGSGTFCQGFDVMLNGFGPPGPGQVNYTWTGPNYSFTGTADCGGPYPATVDNIDLDDEGIYTLVVTKGSCESEEAQVVLEVNPTPEIGNNTSGGVECEGVTLPISFTIFTNGADSVDWTISGGGLDESGTVTDTTEIELEDIVDGDATYTITAISNLGCEAEPVVITITQQDVPEPTIDGPEVPCPGETIELCTGAVPMATFEWCFNGVSIGGPSDDPCILIDDPQEGDYTVKITINGCTKESQPYVLMFPPSPEANDDSFTNDDSFITDAGVPLEANVFGNDIVVGGSVSIISGPANGTVTIDADGNIVYTPNEGFFGTDEFVYEICSEVCEEDCDDALVTIEVRIVDCEVPNVITPNGDGTNDVLIIDCAPAFPNNRLRIFNRWGDEIEVFEPYTNNWDGSSGSGNDPVPAGTYFFLFQEDRNSDDNIAGYIKVVR
ncbi:MAG: gliding motility-associated C-terminal domain-containing protein [Bacteroidota bacterium]